MSQFSKRTSLSVLTSQLAETNSILGSLSDEDVFGKFSLERKASDLKSKIEAIGPLVGNLASASVFFFGRPVIGTQAIEADFAAQTLTDFQDVVSKFYALRTSGLQSRGVVPDKEKSKLHITGTAKGSFGFILEEMGSDELVSSILNESLQACVSLIEAAAADEDEIFDAVSEDLNDRLLDSIGDFFKHLDEADAGMRVVTRNKETKITLSGVDIATRRIRETSVTEEQEIISGRITGLMSETHLFEITKGKGDNVEIIKGSISSSITSHQILSWMSQFSGKDAVATVYAKRVKRRGNQISSKFILNNLALPEPSKTGDRVLGSS